MYQSERLEEILKILNRYHYVTVDYLVEKIRYSPASIRRDLTLLEKQGLVKRSYGGVEIKKDSYTPFRFRQHSMKTEKNSMAEKAAELVSDNDTVFIDGSSSAQYMGHYLLNKKNITVVTNNMVLASYLSENGVRVYCAGGYVQESPGILAGEITNRTFSSFHADVMFFSAAAFDDGQIYTSSEAFLQHHTIMMQNSDKIVFLCGSDKIGTAKNIKVCSLGEIDYFISDGILPDIITSQYKNTAFISTR